MVALRKKNISNGGNLHTPQIYHRLITDLLLQILLQIYYRPQIYYRLQVTTDYLKLLLLFSCNR